MMSEDSPPEKSPAPGTHRPLSGRDTRRQQLRQIADRLGLGAIRLRTFPNFAWYTAGGDNRVDRSSPIGVADVVVTRESEYILTNTIEEGRMREEQTPGFEVVSFPWYEDPSPVLRELAGGGRIGSDIPQGNEVDIADEVAPLRYVLDGAAVELYRRVGAETAAAAAETAAALQPGMTEYEASAALLAACARRGLAAPVIMAAADDRIERYRHPVSGENVPFHRRVMLVVCAERGGLYANLTRFVHFEEPQGDLARRFELCETILRRMRQEATRPGRSLADAFEDCRRFYADAGFPDEWTLHHQGGLTGYATREVIATPSTQVEIQTGQAFAWNPSITGAKTEETFVLTERGPEVLTVDPRHTGLSAHGP